MPSKFPATGKGRLAPGYWGTPWRTIQAMAVPEQVRVMLQDKLVARGRWVGLYNPVGVATPGAVDCTCTKNTTDSADMKCFTCHGTKFAPGFLKYLHQTQFWCSAEASSFTLTNTEVSTAIKANLIQLSKGQTSGTVVTTDKAYSNAVAANYELSLNGFLRASGSTFVLEFSTNSGTSWSPVSLTETTPGRGFVGVIAAGLLPGIGMVRFRLTITRTAVGDLPSSFEIVRIRRVVTENENKVLTRRRPDRVPGSILVLRPWTQEQNSLEPGRALLIENAADQTWTAPLDFFDTSLTHDTPACRITDRLGPHPFYSYASGVQIGTRYIITSVNYNEQFSTMTHQLMPDRRAQDGDSYNLIW